MPLSENPKCAKVNVSYECWVFIHRTGSVSMSIDLGDLFVNISENYVTDIFDFAVYATEKVELHGIINFHKDGTISLRPLGGS